MEKIFKFLDENVEVALATVEDNKPRIRIFQVMKRVEDTFFFATSSQKHVYSQIKENPYVEFTASKDNIFVRVAGKTDFDVDDAMGKTIYNENPILQRLYADYKQLVYFKIVPDALWYFDLTPTPPINEYYDLRKQK